MFTLIGISGKAGSGKDTVANYLYEKYIQTSVLPLAHPLKLCAAAAFGIPVQDFYDREIKEKRTQAWDYSPRQIAQLLGTECFRKVFGEDFWIRRHVKTLNGQLEWDDGQFRNYREGIENHVVCIPDIRFQNEVEYALQGGIIIQLYREEASKQTVGVSNHASEALDFTVPDDYTHRSFTVHNNGTLEELYYAVDKVFEIAGINLTRNPDYFASSDF